MKKDDSEAMDTPTSEGVYARDHARAALSHVHDAQARLATQTIWPLWRHIAFATLEAILVFCAASPSFFFAGGIVVFLGILWIVRDDRRRYGMYVNGWRKGRTRIANLTMMVGLIAAVLWSGAHRSDDYALLHGMGAALFTFLLCIWGSMWWQKLYNAELVNGRES